MQDERFSDVLKTLRKKSGHTLREAASQLGINHSYLSQLETGLAKPSEDLARKIALFFGEDPERLVFLARDIPKVIKEIRDKFPNVAPSYFRKAGKTGDKK